MMLGRLSFAAVGNLTEEAKSLPSPHQPLCRPLVWKIQVTWFVLKLTNHWPVECFRMYSFNSSA